MAKKERPKEQKTSFRELSFLNKIKYIWGYYKYYMLAFVIIALVVISTVFAFIRNNYDTALYIMVVDARLSGCDERTDAITTGMTEYLGIDGKKTRVILDCNNSLKQHLMDNEAIVTRDKIVTLASTSSMDAYLTDRQLIDYFSTDKETFLMDLREILSTKELAAIGEEHIFYYTMENGTKIPIAVDLTDTKIKKDTDIRAEHPCYGVVVTAKNTENAVAFIRYAFDIK